MKYITEYRNKNLVKKVARHIKELMPAENIKFMEVCGTHTHNFLHFGLDKLIPSTLQLISGPGCPVCVSTPEYIDKAILYAKSEETIILTFGDMLRVPGNNSSLEKERASGSDVRVVYSCLDSLKVAKENPEKKIIFLAVGFETTAPTIALTIMQAKKEKIKNLSFFSSLKLIPPAMAHLLSDTRLNIQGFLCPGHVSTIIGTRPYEFIPKRYKIGCSVTGFEPLDILEGLYLLLKQIKENRPLVDNQYRRAVKIQGNPKAKRIINKVFKTVDASWRGLGEVPKSGLKIREEFSQFNTEKRFSISYALRVTSYELRKCRCGDVLKGLILPKNCPLFSKTCKPDTPFGPCMVSSEGTCNAYHRYRRDKF